MNTSDLESTRSRHWWSALC